MIHEFNIMTNDGWVVTLVGDKPICMDDLGNLSSIIVQPKEDHEKRAGQTPDVPRTEYRLQPFHESDLVRFVDEDAGGIK